MSNQINQTEVTERAIPCLQVMQGHQVGVYGALLLRDGRLLSYSPDEPFLLWDPHTGELLGKIPANEASIGGAFQIDDDHVITWPEPRDEAEDAHDFDEPSPENGRKPRYPSPFEPSQIVVWNIRTLERNPLKCECISPVAGMFQFKNGRIHAWSLDGSFSAWYADAPEKVYRCDPLVRRMWEVTMLSDERQLLRSSEHELRILSNDDSFDLVLRGHHGTIRQAFELSGNRILSCSEDRTLRIWDATNGVCEHILKGHKEAVVGACELPDGKILSWSPDETFRIWDASTGKCLSVIHDRRAALTWRGIRLPGWKILLWSQTTESWLFNPAEGRIESILSGHEGTIRGFVVLPNGNGISYSDDRTLRLWQVGAVEGLKQTEESMKEVIPFTERCKSFHRTRRTSGHLQQQTSERRTTMSDQENQPSEATATSQCFMDYLAEEGFRPDIDKDGDIHFKAEGRHFFILNREKDRQFVQLLHPNFWSIESEEERQKVLVAANLTTGRCKCCKVFAADDNTSAAVEMFVAEPGHAVAVLERALGSLQNGVKTFIEEMRKEAS